MAKQPKGGTSRIRFIMLDAEIPEGDLSQLTSAIQNALKPTTIVQQRPPNQLAAPTLTADGVPSNRIDQEPSGLDDGASAAREVLREPRESRARKPSVPKVLDLDLTSGLSFESYANDHRPKNDADRNLVVAAWFKEHRGENAISVHHVYTCYRAMKWPSGIEDFSGSLRYLKKKQLMASAGRGLYAINHLGLDRVRELEANRV